MFLNRVFSRWTALAGLLVSLAVTAGLFALSATTDVETAPESGAPSASEAAKVARIVSAFPESAGTSIWVVYDSA
jgi:hypothetical protein